MDGPFSRRRRSRAFEPMNRRAADRLEAIGRPGPTPFNYSRKIQTQPFQPRANERFLAPRRPTRAPGASVPGFSQGSKANRAARQAESANEPHCKRKGQAAYVFP